jgi:hypothetical protein
MGSISIKVDTNADAGLGGTGLAASADGRKLAAKITMRAAATTNKPRAAMAPLKKKRRCTCAWISSEFYEQYLSVTLYLWLVYRVCGIYRDVQLTRMEILVLERSADQFFVPHERERDGQEFQDGVCPFAGSSRATGSGQRPPH